MILAPSMDFEPPTAFVTSTLSSRRAEESFDPSRLLVKNATEGEWVALLQARRSLQKLASFAEDWDTYGSPAPNPEAIQRAFSFLVQAQRGVRVSGYVWVNPHVSASDDASVTLEWWHGSHKLSIYVSAKATEFVQVWGPDIVHQMKDGEIHGEDFVGLWRWLNA